MDLYTERNKLRRLTFAVEMLAVLADFREDEELYLADWIYAIQSDVASGRVSCDTLQSMAEAIRERQDELEDIYWMETVKPLCERAESEEFWDC